MDKSNRYPNPPYESAFAETENSRLLQQATHNSNYLPSTPPSHFSYSSILQTQPIYSYQNDDEQVSESPQMHRYIIKSRNRGDRHFPVNAAFFVLGWLFPPLWFIGCCWNSQSIYENAWRKANICMTILSLIALTLFLVFMTLLVLEERQNLPPTNSGDLPSLPPL